MRSPRSCPVGTSRLPRRHVPLARAAGLTPADALRAHQLLPGFNTAAMDGYAGGPGPGPWGLRGAICAGTPWTGGTPGLGEAVAISTGAAVAARVRSGSAFWQRVADLVATLRGRGPQVRGRMAILCSIYQPTLCD
ncbi:hypothetical protein [Streptomyces sp. NBC_01431]|uniref:hypothetical protein n=1 Tax=Streptomyces sp. NBC_01431 TaxID=2903863 RepID=UPI003FCE1400